MGSEIAELFTILRLEGAPFAKGLTASNEEADASASKIGASWQKLAKLGAASAVVMVAGAGAAVKLAMNFDQQMAMVHTQAGASLGEVKALSGQVLALAGQVGIGPTKLAEGLYHVESAGFRGATAMGILTAAAKLAAIGGSDLETTTQAVVGVMASEIKGVKGAADAGNLLNTTVGIGDMRMQQLAGAIATGILPKAKSVGLSFEDVGAALATITDNVTPANEAATRLGMTFSMMAAPTQKAQQMMQTLGMTSSELGNDLRTKGLVGALQDLKAHLNATYPPGKAVILSLKQQKEAMVEYSKSLSDSGVPLGQQKDMMAAYAKQLKTTGSTAVEQSQAISALFGGGKSSGTILTLLGEMPRLQSKMAGYGTAATRAAQAQDAWKTQQGQFSQQLKELGASAESFGVKVGNYLIPPLQKALSFLTSHQVVLKAFAIILGTVMVAAMIAWTATVVANTAAMLADPMTWIILAIIAAVGLLIVGIYELVKHWGTVWAWIKRIAGDVWGWLKTAWFDTIHALEAAAMWVKTKVIDPIVGFFEKYLIAPIKFYLNILRAIWTAVWTVVRTVILFSWGFISTVFDSIRSKIVNFLIPIIQVLRRGWEVAWDGIKKAASFAYNNVIKPTAEAIKKYAIDPIKAGIKDLERAWDVSWAAIKAAAKGAYNDVIKPTAGFIVHYGVDPIKVAIKALETSWDKVWGAVKSAVSKAWAFISPIFTKIHNAINSITSGLSKITSSPGAAGSKLAHMLGFDQGGFVPGAPGAPMVAVVHGGEFVMSRDMLAGKTATPIRMGSAAGGIGSGSGGSVMVQMPDIYLDGKKVYKGQTTRAQRTKNRNGTSFLG